MNKVEMIIAKIIAYALSQVGYSEKNTAQNLQSFTESGSKNYNKYALICFMLRLFGGVFKQGYEWCALFVAACMAAGGFNSKEAIEGVLCQSGDFAASCRIAAGYYKAAGRFDNNPRKGDQVFFIVGGEIGHTGLVVDVDGEYITTVEGNSGNKVAKNRYKIGDPKIGGYGHPRYEEFANFEPSYKTLVDVAKTDALVAVPELRKGDKSAEVAWLQYILIQWTGLQLEIDGDFGAKTEEAVKIIQTALGLDVDGVAGRETMAVIRASIYVEMSDDAPENMPSDALVNDALKAAANEAMSEKIEKLRGIFDALESGIADAKETIGQL